MGLALQPFRTEGYKREISMVGRSILHVFDFFGPQGN